jgi:hypothetical protein
MNLNPNICLNHSLLYRNVDNSNGSILSKIRSLFKFSYGYKGEKVAAVQDQAELINVV